MPVHNTDLKKIKITKTKDKPTMASGLGTLIELFDQSPLKNELIA